MPQELLRINIGQMLSKYQYPDKAKRDICAALRQYRNLRLKLDTYVFNDGTREELACFDGTIPVMFKGTYYHIPVCTWLLYSYPSNSPVCYVKPTSNMQINVSECVDTNGRVYLPYLRNWQPDTSDLLGLIQVMIIEFGETPPVYRKPKLPNSASYTSTPCPVESRKEVQERLKSIKDSSLKSIKNEEGTSGDARKTKKEPYVYHKQMSFLEAVYQQRETLGNMNADNDSVNTESPAARNVEPAIVAGTCSRKPKKQMADPFEKEILDIQKANLVEPTKKIAQDPDEIFLISQLRNIKKIKPSSRFQFQIKFMELIQDFIDETP